MKTPILLIINPKAGSIDPEEVISKVKAQLSCDNKHELEIYETTGEKDEVELKSKFAARSYEYVLVAGGDGTINLVASLVANSKVKLGILPCGSANGLATALQLPDTLEEQIHVAIGDNQLTMDGIMIIERLCLHIADLGINAELIRNFDNMDIRGLFGYFLQSIPTLFNSNYPYDFNIHLPESTRRRKGILLAFANATKYGTGAMINPEGKVDDGLFEVIIFKQFNFFHILKTFFNISKHHPEFAESYPVSAVTIECKSPVALQVDGEYLGEFKKIEARVANEVLRVSIP